MKNTNRMRSANLTETEFKFKQIAMKELVKEKSIHNDSSIHKLSNDGISGNEKRAMTSSTQ